eukprot:78212-Chlamydomonas_euryale.AAC.1
MCTRHHSPQRPTSLPQTKKGSAHPANHLRCPRLPGAMYTFNALGCPLLGCARVRLPWRLAWCDVHVGCVERAPCRHARECASLGGSRAPPARATLPACATLRARATLPACVRAQVAAETLLVWARALFYGLAVDGLGTFVFMIIEIIKGLKYFYLLLLVVYVSFDVALLNLFRPPPSGSQEYNEFFGFRDFGASMLSLWINSFQALDAREAE